MGIAKTVKDNIEVIMTGRYESGRINLNDVWNLGLLRLTRKFCLLPEKSLPKLSREQKKRLKKFWSPYFVSMTDRYHRQFLKCTGQFSELFIPEEIMFMYIDRYYCNRQETKYLDNKCLYYKLFNGINMPEAVALRVRNQWFDENYRLIDKESAISLICSCDEVVVKEAKDSEGGHGVYFVKGTDSRSDIESLLDSKSADLVVQKTIKQHPFFAKFNEKSVNTMRIISFLFEGEVKIIYPGMLRFGKPGSRTDNVSVGGSIVGIDRDGTLSGRAINSSYEVEREIAGYGSDFAGLKIPGYEGAIEIIKRAHPCVGQARIIHWDIAVDENERAVLVEANFSMGSVMHAQSLGSPLFGEYTKRVLDEVFENRKRIFTLL